MSDTTRKPFIKRTFSNPRTEHVVVGHSKFDSEKRANLLRNAELGMGKSIQKGKHLSYTVGSDEYGYVEYLIVDASLPIV